MKRDDIINSFEYKVSREAVERAKDGIDIPSFEDGAEFAQKLIYSNVIEWLYDQACRGWIEDVEVEKFVDKFKKHFGYDTRCAQL